MSRDTVVFVSAGMLRPKKHDNAVARLHLYLNYGLLSLASVVDRSGLTACVHHGRFSSPYDFVMSLAKGGVLETQFSLFLSLPSTYAIPWAQEFCRLAKLLYPCLKIIVGGRWVIGSEASWISQKLPQASLFVYGTAEDRVLELLNYENWPRIHSTSRSFSLLPEPPLLSLPDLNYLVMPDFREFQPSLELSRGCGLGCSFCLEKASPLGTMRTPQHTVEALGLYTAVYGTPYIHPYFESSYFRPTMSWSREFRDLYKNEGLGIQWRCETRVDGLSPEILSNLAQTGLKVVDLGLESASATQLLRMRKTSKPTVYLQRASTFLRECKSLGIWAKVNVLLYAGETFDTLKETIDWLESHRECIKGVSVNPLTVYGHDVSAKQFLDEVSQWGARPVDSIAWMATGLTQLHLSDVIDYDMSMELCRLISKQFMSDRDYYDLKSFSYFPRSMSYAKFRELIEKVSHSDWPFTVRGQNLEAHSDRHTGFAWRR